jgi:Protein of unknown function (DUF3443)
MRPMLFAPSLFASKRVLYWLAALCLSVLLAACGGGGGGGGSGPGSDNSPPAAPSNAAGTNQPIAPTASNTVPITVGPGAANFVNIPNVTVTVCAPGTNTCQTIDNIQLDTGSFGLRIASDAAPQLLNSLPIAAASNNSQLAECTQFADGFTWGTIRTADVKIGGETASHIPVQIAGDLPASTVPASNCITGVEESTVAQLGANGILGVGVATADCGVGCLNPSFSNYYSCPNGKNCTQVGVTVAQQVTNPVSQFATDNNGVIVQLSPLSGGAGSVSGTLVFGIGTQSNNTLSDTPGGVTSFPSDGAGDLNGAYKGTSVATIFDTGSNGIFFNDNTIPNCTSTFTDFYCPTSTLNLAATVNGISGTTAAVVNFTVANAQKLAGNGTNFALNGLAGNVGNFPTLFDFGLPFFFGKHVYFAFDTTASAPFIGF